MEVNEKKFFEEVFNVLLDDSDNVLKFPKELLKTEKGDETEVTHQESAKALDIRLKGRQARYIKKVEMAFEKFKAGEFGTCEECGDEISFERLKARPTATMCIHCKEEQERAEGHIASSKKSSGSGKSLYRPTLIQGGAQNGKTPNSVKEAMIS